LHAVRGKAAMRPLFMTLPICMEWNGIGFLADCVSGGHVKGICHAERVKVANRQ
jgi:hypothetical protein